MRIMEWHQKVFFAFFFFFILYSFYWFSKQQQSSYRYFFFFFQYYFCFFYCRACLLHWNFNSLLASSMWSKDFACVTLYWSACLVFVILTEFWNAFMIHAQTYASRCQRYTRNIFMCKWICFFFFSLRFICLVSQKEKWTKRKQKPKHNDNKSVEKCGKHKMTQTFCENCCECKRAVRILGMVITLWLCVSVLWIADVMNKLTRFSYAVWYDFIRLR